MEEIVCFECEINIVNGKKRIKEIRYSGFYNEDGSFRLTRLIGKYYTVVENKDYCANSIKPKNGAA